MPTDTKSPREKLSVSSKLRQLAVPTTPGLSPIATESLKFPDTVRPALAR